MDDQVIVVSVARRVALTAAMGVRFDGGPGGIRTRDLPVPRVEYLANRTFFGL